MPRQQQREWWLICYQTRFIYHGDVRAWNGGTNLITASYLTHSVQVTGNVGEVNKWCSAGGGSDAVYWAMITRCVNDVLDGTLLQHHSVSKRCGNLFPSTYSE